MKVLYLRWTLLTAGTPEFHLPRKALDVKRGDFEYLQRRPVRGAMTKDLKHLAGDMMKDGFAHLHKTYETWPETASPNYSVDLTQMKRAAVEEALRNLDATLSLAYEAATDSNKSFLRQRLNEAQYRLNAFTEALEDLAGIKRTR